MTLFVSICLLCGADEEVAKGSDIEMKVPKQKYCGEQGIEILSAARACNSLDARTQLHIDFAEP